MSRHRRNFYVYIQEEKCLMHTLMMEFMGEGRYMEEKE